MSKARSFGKSVVAALGVGAGIGILAPAGALGQVTRERDVTITGPRGRTIQRDFKSTITPGGIDRTTTITRPGGTFSRSVDITRSGGFGGGPRFGPGPRNVFVERPVFVGGGGGLSPGASFGIGALAGTAGGLLLGSALASPPPPVYVTPMAPIVVAPGPVVGPTFVQPVQPPIVAGQPLAVDMVPREIARLSSIFGGTRREAAGILGRMHDPRAIPALVERLKNDTDKSVRIAAAGALGEISDPGAAVYLERSSIYDHKQEVRNASTAALTRLPRVVPAGSVRAVGPDLSPHIHRGPTATATVPVLEQATRVPPPPTPASGERR